MARLRTKTCSRCDRPMSVLYRVQQDESRQWFFICPDCFPAVRQDNPYYVYGGTWKSHKRH